MLSRFSSLAVVLGLALLGSARLAVGQGAPADFFSEPILILSGGGHHAPVRSLIFSNFDGSELLTGGMDKAIHVWNLGADRTRPARTLRPPQWRAYRGQVNAMALSPRPAVGDERLLAVAGYGVLAESGEILLFRYPGPNVQGTGDVEGMLAHLEAQPGRPEQAGHTNVVTSMAFTPDGRYLASSSNDKTVRLWNLADRRSVAVMSEAQGAVNALAILRAGTRLVAGGDDGILRLYDITERTRPQLVALTAPIPGSGPILTLAASPDDRWIFVGTEGGQLIRFEATKLAGAILSTTSNGPVEGLAISPDSARIATSTIARNLPGRPDDPRSISCLIEIRAIPGGQLLETLPLASNLVFAMGFSPDGRRLAYSGGDSQSIYLKPIGPGAGPVEEIAGQGSSLWDVGFRLDHRAIRFSRSRPPAPGQATDYLGFHLRDRFLFDPEAGEPAYRHATMSEAGWTIQPVGIARVDFRDAQGQVWSATLNPETERRTNCFTIIPPNPAAGHPDPVAAVGCQTGVILWNLRTRQTTRFFTGHAGPVYALASSPDGKWLVTGSSDQTARIWPLAGSDRRPPFGARFAAQADGSWTIAEITPGGFAEGIKLRPGQKIEAFFVGAVEQTKAQTAAILPRLDDQPPTTFFSFHARTGVEPELLKVGATRRDSPALSFFPAIDREWIYWTPRGHYDTSVAGDRRYLGWLTNQGTPTRLLAGRLDTIDKFEPRFRQPKAPLPNAIDRLLDTGDPLLGAAGASPVAPGAADPRTSGLTQLAATPIAVGPFADPIAPLVPGRPVVVRQPRVTLRYLIEAARQASRIARATVEVNGQTVGTIVGGAPVESVTGTIEVPVGTSRNPMITLKTLGEDGVSRSVLVPIENLSPEVPGRRKSRLEILTIGSETFAANRLPRIRYAREDTDDLSTFLQERLIDPATGIRFAAGQVRVRSFGVRNKLAVGPLIEALDDWKKATRDGRLESGDVVALVVESHFFQLRSERFLATDEPAPSADPASISATILADRLGELAHRGCRVLVFLDAVHEVETPGWDNDIKNWVRDLQSIHDLAIFVAADHGPSRVVSGHRAFADGVLHVLEAKNASRLRKQDGPMNLFDFQRTLIDLVLENTGRRQHAKVHLPDTIPLSVPLLDASELGPTDRVGGTP